jgi:hypothetical protein
VLIGNSKEIYKRATVGIALKNVYLIILSEKKPFDVCILF